jgi:CRISPR/Cas system-associated exonuclease Cas4 (RecB family)|tara:strand:- start:2261 stop:2926 length:666 start_codon:yes stop_codon:yes gene_type:complete
MNTSKSKWSAQELVAEAIKDGRGGDRKIVSWHASGLGSCLTGRYLERLGVPADKEFDDRTLRVFSVGHVFEDWYVGLLEKKAKVERQVRVEDKKYNFSGYVDAIVGGMVYEIKSKHSRAFWWMEKNGDASIHNKMQLWSYLWKLEIDEGRLVYISKDDLGVAEYIVLRKDKELRDLVINELKVLNEAWEQQLPPEPIRDKKHWHAKYCRWHKQCLSQDTYL